ncbi:MAG TPA: hypothetical protein VME22_23705 [Solirubrobacteraceae bacterium]|nr:hypothetical protein [Solirubrobacteraceae bacterium]
MDGDCDFHLLAQELGTPLAAILLQLEILSDRLDRNEAQLAAAPLRSTLRMATGGAVMSTRLNTTRCNVLSHTREETVVEIIAEAGRGILTVTV